MKFPANLPPECQVGAKYGGIGYPPHCYALMKKQQCGQSPQNLTCAYGGPATGRPLAEAPAESGVPKFIGIGLLLGTLWLYLKSR